MVQGIGKFWSHEGTAHHSLGIVTIGTHYERANNRKLTTIRNSELLDSTHEI